MALAAPKWPGADYLLAWSADGAMGQTLNPGGTTALPGEVANALVLESDGYTTNGTILRTTRTGGALVLDTDPAGNPSVIFDQTGAFVRIGDISLDYIARNPVTVCWVGHPNAVGLADYAAAYFLDAENVGGLGSMGMAIPYTPGTILGRQVSGATKIPVAGPANMPAQPVPTFANMAPLLEDVRTGTPPRFADAGFVFAWNAASNFGRSLNSVGETAQLSDSVYQIIMESDGFATDGATMLLQWGNAQAILEVDTDGMVGLNFIGNERYRTLAANDALSWADTNEQTVFIVFRPNVALAGPNNGLLVASNGRTSNRGCWNLTYSATDHMFRASAGNASVTMNIPLADGLTWAALATPPIQQAGLMEGYTDPNYDSATTVAATSPLPLTTLSLGTDPVDNGLFEGFIYETFAYSRRLTAAEVDEVAAYIDAKYQATPVGPPTFPGAGLLLGWAADGTMGATLNVAGQPASVGETVSSLTLFSAVDPGGELSLPSTGFAAPLVDRNGWNAIHCQSGYWGSPSFYTPSAQSVQDILQQGGCVITVMEATNAQISSYIVMGSPNAQSVMASFRSTTMNVDAPWSQGTIPTDLVQGKPVWNYIGTPTPAGLALGDGIVYRNTLDTAYGGYGDTTSWTPGLRLGSNWDGNYGLTGWIYEFFAYPRPLTTQEQDEVFAYLDAKYSPVAPPITYNIHNAPPWAPSAPYAVGDRVTNGPYAYQCTVAGTTASGGGPTGTGQNIQDGSVTWKWLSATDYTSIGAAIAAIKPITGPVTLEVWNDAVYSGATIDLAGTGASTTNTLSIVAAPGESVGSNPMARANPLVPSRTSKPLGVTITAPIVAGDAGLDFAGLVFDSGPGGGTAFQGNGTTSGSQLADLTFDRCVFLGLSASNGLDITGSLNMRAENCVFSTNNQQGNVFLNIRNGTGSVFEFCTMVGFQGNYAQADALYRNCYIQLAGTAPQGTALGCGTDSASTFPGFTSGLAQAIQFQSVGLNSNSDLRTLYGNGLAGIGVASAVTIDITGHPRGAAGNITIGAWQHGTTPPKFAGADFILAFATDLTTGRMVQAGGAVIPDYASDDLITTLTLSSDGYTANAAGMALAPGSGQPAIVRVQTGGTGHAALIYPNTGNAGASHGGGTLRTVQMDSAIAKICEGSSQFLALRPFQVDLAHESFIETGNNWTPSTIMNVGGGVANIGVNNNQVSPPMTYPSPVTDFRVVYGGFAPAATGGTNLMRITGGGQTSLVVTPWGGHNAGFNLGCSWEANWWCFVGEIYEVVIYSRELTTQEQDQVFAYLETKYGAPPA